MDDTIESEIQKLVPSAMIELFEVDLTALGDTVYYFHAGTNELTQPVVWQGATYQPWAAQATGFDFNTSGQLPRPKLALANVQGTITALVLAMNDCLGGKVTRRRTMAKFLDAVNFDGGVNATADPDAHLPDETYYIDRKASETPLVVEFELTAPFDVTGVKLPRRQIIQNICPWRYRGGECGYAGPPLARADDSLLEAPDATTPAEFTYISTRDAYKAAVATVATRKVELQAAVEAFNQAGEPQLAQTQYAKTAMKYHVRITTNVKNAEVGRQAYWNNALVTVGDTYRIGVFKQKEPAPTGEDAAAGLSYSYYEIEKWEIDAGDLAAATTEKNTAQTNYDNAVTARNAALSAYNAAIAALPSDSPMIAADVCGKRLASCKLRFGETSELPFGGFPGAGLL